MNCYNSDAATKIYNIWRKMQMTFTNDMSRTQGFTWVKEFQGTAKNDDERYGL
jgi:hypothetical protein